LCATREGVQAVAGVSSVKVKIENPSPAGRARPLVRCRSPDPRRNAGVGKVPRFRAGKGGWASTVSANLAAALFSAAQGHKVGLMDADIYGPNIPRMFGLADGGQARGARRQDPAARGARREADVARLIVERDAPAIWRGPIIMKIITQFCRDVAWESSTTSSWTSRRHGDAQLSLTPGDPAAQAP